jgi:hypothetical protein
MAIVTVVHEESALGVAGSLYYGDQPHPHACGWRRLRGTEAHVMRALPEALKRMIQSDEHRC